MSPYINMVPFDMLGIVSYNCAIVNLSVRCSVFEIFDFKYAVTMKTRLGVHQGHHSIERIWLPIDVL